MSELRRNGGPDDGDEPVENDKSADRPVERPGLEIRSADMNEKWPVRRHLVTPAQRNFIRTEGANADAPDKDAPSTFAFDWKSKEPIDARKPPPAQVTDRVDPADQKVPDRPEDSAPGLPSLDARVLSRR